MAGRRNKGKRARQDNPVPKGKNPRAVRSGPGGKNPSAVPYDREEVMGRRLVWRFADVDHHGDWHFGDVEPAELVDLLTRMGSFESMTVREVFFRGEEPGKTYDVDALPSRTQDRLRDLGREDETKLARLRCGGQPRLYGFLREHVFHVLWWDREHQVFPSRKRNT